MSFQPAIVGSDSYPPIRAQRDWYWYTAMEPLNLSRPEAEVDRATHSQGICIESGITNVLFLKAFEY
ncbi:hypothetical protein IAQ61_007532 [Plenodomus lingam]|uniref:uncharacterized protein n=1 Tax=Leptosphaeria maculans TaxID=5022 RepID=UPI0033333D55|nr:hypothetical protein IAQ61_007532 [Plenodomus lingam]